MSTKQKELAHVLRTTLDTLDREPPVKAIGAIEWLENDANRLVRESGLFKSAPRNIPPEFHDRVIFHRREIPGHDDLPPDVVRLNEKSKKGESLSSAEQERVLSFGTKAKPHGAVRMELFFEFVKPGQPVPMKPDELSGWPRCLRSFTTTPMRVKHPVPAVSGGPMLIVYWARWADATGEVGPWSRTLVTRIEGAIPGMASEVVPENGEQAKRGGAERNLQLAG